MAIDEPGKHGHRRQVDDRGARRYGHVRADGLDFGAANDDDLVREDASRRHIDEPAATDGGAGRGASRTRRSSSGRVRGGGRLSGQACQRCEIQTEQREYYFLVHKHPSIVMTRPTKSTLRVKNSHRPMILLFDRSSTTGR